MEAFFGRSHYNNTYTYSGLVTGYISNMYSMYMEVNMRYKMLRQRNNVHVSFDITCPSDVTKKELEAYLKYELQIVDELPCDNPLDAHDICVLDVRNLVIKK